MTVLKEHCWSFMSLMNMAD